MRTLHLNIFGQEPAAVEGPFGCDYAFYAQYDFAAYRCLPHRWVPGSDASYAEYQARDLVDYGDEDEGDQNEAAEIVSAPPPPPAVIAPEADLYGDNALDIEF